MSLPVLVSMTQYENSKEAFCGEKYENVNRTSALQRVFGHYGILATSSFSCKAKYFFMVLTLYPYLGAY